MFRPSSVAGLDNLAEQVRARLSSLEEGVLLHDVDGRIRAASPGSQSLLGVSTEALLERRSLLEILTAWDVTGRPLPLAECPSLRCHHTAQPQPEVVLRANRPDERVVWLAVRCQPLFAKDRSRAGTITFFDDVTERTLADASRERLYREAREALSSRDEFLAIAAHELKTPITGMMLHLQSLLRRAHRVEPTQMVEGLAATVRQAQRLQYLVEVLLDVAQISGGRLSLAVREVDLGQLVREVAERSREELDRAGCRLQLKVMESVSGKWDAVRLEQVVANLLSNACKYASGAPVEVEVTRQDGHAVVRVRDNGDGISAEDQDRIFGRYQRAPAEGSFQGLGLGLWIVREIVEAHGGEVRVKSEPGSGAEFLVTLPAATAGLRDDRRA